MSIRNVRCVGTTFAQLTSIFINSEMMNDLLSQTRQRRHYFWSVYKATERVSCRRIFGYRIYDSCRSQTARTLLPSLDLRQAWLQELVPGTMFVCTTIRRVLHELLGDTLGIRNPPPYALAFASCHKRLWVTFSSKLFKWEINFNSSIQYSCHDNKISQNFIKIILRFCTKIS